MDELTDDELIVVMALAMYWNSHGSFEEGEKFEAAMEEAREFASTSKRSHVIANLSPKKFSEYLPQVLRRAGLD